MIRILIYSLLSYLIGSISGSFLLGKLLMGVDVRTMGSGNAGTTNAMRTMGKKIGILTFIIDLIKGVVVLYLFQNRVPENYILMLLLFCVIGHNFPFYMNFKGGKGIATTFGGLFFLHPLLTAIGGLIGLIVALLSKYVSLGSLFFLVSTCAMFILVGNAKGIEIVFLLLLTFLGIWRHRSNIERLMLGNENKLGDLKWKK